MNINVKFDKDNDRIVVAASLAFRSNPRDPQVTFSASDAVEHLVKEHNIKVTISDLLGSDYVVRNDYNSMCKGSWTFNHAFRKRNKPVKPIVKIVKPVLTPPPVIVEDEAPSPPPRRTRRRSKKTVDTTVT